MHPLTQGIRNKIRLSTTTFVSCPVCPQN